MEVFLIKTLQLLLCFCLLIILHEGGHFFFAKLFKVRVPTFCLFFGPWKKWRLFSWKGTDYCIGWLPLGGYVEIAGMIDESLNTEQMKAPAKPDEFRSKPAWQRLLIMAGGVLVNFLTALIIYAMILFCNGDTYTPAQNMTHGYKFNAAAQQYGFRDGDILMTIDGEAIDRFSVKTCRQISTAKSVGVLRDGKSVEIALPGDLNMLDMLQARPPFVDVLAPSVIDSVAVGLPAERAGLRPGDRIVGLNGMAMTTWNEFNQPMDDRTATIQAYVKDGNTAMADSFRHVSVVVERAQTAQRDTVPLLLTEEGTMGIFKRNPYADYRDTTITYGFMESFPAGAAYGWGVLKDYVSDLRYVFSAEGAKSVGSFGTIGSLFPAQWDWLKFWNLTAFISIMLAFLNVLPIPALDGGHIFFLLCEVVTRRKPSDKFMYRAQIVGMCLLFALMALAVFNDLARFVF